MTSRVPVFNERGSVYYYAPTLAEALVRMGRVTYAKGGQTYLTRDLQAAAPAVVVAPAPGEPVTPPAPVAAPTPSKAAASASPVAADVADGRSAVHTPLEVDSAGVAWDGALHSPSKLQNADGTWRKRSGPKSA